MNLSLNMRKKGLLLVSVPLIFELGFILILVSLLNQVEDIAAKEKHSNAVVVETENVFRTTYDTAGAFVLFCAAKSKSFGDRYEATAKGIPAVLSDLKEKIGPDPVQQENFSVLEDEANKALELMRGVKKQIEDQETIAGVVAVTKLRREVIKRLNALMDSSKKIVDEEHRRSEQYPLQEQSARLQKDVAIAAGVLLNIMITLALAVYFSRDLTQRLAAIYRNAVLLSSGADLPPAVKGSDEIAELDKVVHSVADTLTEASRRERVILDNVQDAICTLESNLTISKVNPAAVLLMGYEVSELLGQRFSNLLSRDDREKVYDALQQSKTGDPSVGFEARLLCKDGTPVWMLFSTFWSVSENRFFCVGHDVNERKILDQMKQDFLNMVSHDLRTPLLSVNAFIEMLGAGVYGTLSDKGDAAAKRVESSVGRLVVLINELLEIEKLESGSVQLNLVPMQLSSIVNDGIDMVRAFAEQQHLTIALDSGTDSEVMADSTRLVQVVQNILSNAIKFSTKETVIKVSYNTADGQAEVRIQDSGPGISPEQQKLVFDRFRQLDNQGEIKGSGLGLAICKSIIEQHGGEIGVTSEPGQGSCFWFRIPTKTLASATPLTVGTSGQGV